MSGPAVRPGSAVDSAVDIVLDAGVLAATPTCEWQGWSAVAIHSGLAILPWRAHARAARAAAVVNQSEAPPPGAFKQAVVRIGKGRAATQADVAAAWLALAPGGRLLICGTNDVGISTWAKRLAVAIGVPGEVLVNRAHGRVVAFPRTAAVLPRPPCTVVPLPDGTSLQIAPGVFSGDGLDGGTALLLQAIAELDLAPDFSGKIVDVGCGAGHLGLAAARRWPAAAVTLLDADARAVACARHNTHGYPITVTWWDDHDAWPVAEADVVVMNPPCHAGTSVDLSVARRLFGIVKARRLLVVANRQLAYEADLQRLGAVDCVAEDGRFKVLSVTCF